MVAHTRRISPGSGLNVGTAMPSARPERPAWSEPSPQARSSTSNLSRSDSRARVLVAPVEVGRARPEVLVRRLVRIEGGCRRFFGCLGDGRDGSGRIDERVFRRGPVKRGLFGLDALDAVHRVLESRLLLRL